MGYKENKKRNKGGRPKKGATDKMTYRVAVKMAAADYFRLLARAYEVGVSPSGYMRGYGRMQTVFAFQIAQNLHRPFPFVRISNLASLGVDAQRERELAAVEQSDCYKLMMVRQFRQTGRKVWPVVRCMPADAEREVARFLNSGDYRPSIILYDLPGTVNAEGIIGVLSSLDRLFVPMKADKVVLESTLSFARTRPRRYPRPSSSRPRRGRRT